MKQWFSTGELQPENDRIAKCNSNAINKTNMNNINKI